MQPLPLDVDACIALVGSARWATKVAIDTDGCWQWTGAINSDGYAHVHLDGKVRQAHRVAWVAANLHDVPDGLHLDHLCRVRSCVLASHLQPVTPRENTLRGQTLAAAEIARTHCIRGHELRGDNLRRVGRKRSCRRCQMDGDALRREAARLLCLPLREYFATYGQSRVTAEEVLGDDLVVKITDAQRSGAWT